MKSRPTEHTRRGRKSGVRSTYHEREKETPSDEGQELLEDKDIWGNETTLLGVIHESRKRGRINEDGSFTGMSQQTGFSERGREESCWESG